MTSPKRVGSINTSLSIPQYCSINYLSILPSLQSVLQHCQPSALRDLGIMFGCINESTYVHFSRDRMHDAARFEAASE